MQKRGKEGEEDGIEYREVELRKMRGGGKEGGGVVKEGRRWK